MNARVAPRMARAWLPCIFSLQQCQRSANVVQAGAWACRIGRIARATASIFFGENTMAKKKAKAKKAATKTARPKKGAAKTVQPKEAAARTVKPKKAAMKTAKAKKGGQKIRPKPVVARKKPAPKKPALKEPIVAPITFPPSVEPAAEKSIVEPADTPTPAEMAGAQPPLSEPMLEEPLGGGEERDGVHIDYKVETDGEAAGHRPTRPEDDEGTDRPTQVPPGPITAPPTQTE
jgi:hypothetical protein